MQEPFDHTRARYSYLASYDKDNKTIKLFHKGE